MCLASKGDTAHGTLLPQGLTGGDWWTATGSAALRTLVDPLTFSHVEERILSGKGWIAAACELGVIGAAQIETLRPRTLIADKFLPPAMADAAQRIGAAIVEPVFAAQSVLHMGNDRPPIDPLALTPLYPREPEAVTLWRTRKP